MPRTQQHVDPDANWQETDLAPGWTVREEFAVQNGRRVVAELRVRPTVAARVPDGGVTARLLRRIKVGTFAPLLRRLLAKHLGARQGRLVYDGFVGAPRRTRRPRAPRASDRFYADLAREYVWLWQSGTKTPTAELARRRRVKLARMRSWIHLARANGFLSDTTRGKAGGEITKRTRGLLGLSAVPVAVPMKGPRSVKPHPTSSNRAHKNRPKPR